MTTNLHKELELIFGRRSVRVYSPGEISETTVKLLLEAAMAAPSAMTKDPWRFVTVRRPETLAAMAAALPGGRMLATSGMAILACGDIEVAFESNIGYLVQDVSAAIQNLLLAAHGLGLGACWVGVYPSEPSIRKMAELFRLPGSIVPIAAISIGVPGESPEARTRFNPASVRSEKW